MRVVIADDSGLLREALARLLTEAGIEVCAAVGDAEQLETAVAAHRPDAAVIDIRMPPTYTHEGAEAAIRLREHWPALGILLLSQSLESRYAAVIARTNPQGFGYLLKDRVAGASTLVDALDEVTHGGTVLDPSVVSYLLGRNADSDLLNELTDRERDVLTLMAQGRSNNAISRELSLSTKTVEGHIASVFSKLGLVVEGDDNRRVLAVLRWLQPS
jgi:DNA-binding NarL/FixJ family response regulator